MVFLGSHPQEVYLRDVIQDSNGTWAGSIILRQWYKKIWQQSNVIVPTLYCTEDMPCIAPFDRLTKKT